MIKSAQNVIGSVMCCPGCFSLYRASAVRDILANYAGPTQSAFDVFIKDTGSNEKIACMSAAGMAAQNPNHDVQCLSIVSREFSVPSTSAGYTVGPDPTHEPVL